MRKIVSIFVAVTALSACGGGDGGSDDEGLYDRLDGISLEELQANLVDKGYPEDQAQCIVGMIKGAEGLDTLGVGFVAGGCAMTEDEVEEALFGG